MMENILEIKCCQMLLLGLQAYNIVFKLDWNLKKKNNKKPNPTLS
jgi:hypothetical protein